MECEFDSKADELRCCLAGYILVAASMIDRECMRRYARNDPDRVAIELRQALQSGGMHLLAEAAISKNPDELAKAIIAVARLLVGRLCRG